MFGNSFLAGLKSVLEELAKIEGHRTLLLVSDGFTLRPGEEPYAIASAYLPDSPYFKFDPARDIQAVLDESLKIAAAHDIVVSAIDARGVYSPSFSQRGLSDASSAAPRSVGASRGGTVLEDMDSNWSSVEQHRGSVLAQLAEATGGIYFHNSTDLLQGFRKILEAGESYVLAYVPKNPTADGKFRQITVTVNAPGVKPGNLVVRSKSGYRPEPAQDKH